jgi:hypothetical protein
MVGRFEAASKLALAPLVKFLLKASCLDLVAEPVAAAVDLASKDLDQDDVRRDAEQLIHRLAADIAAEHARQFETDSVDVDHHKVAEALAAVFEAAASPRGLLSRNLDPERLTNELGKTPPPKDFGVPERELYESVLRALAKALVGKAHELRGYDTARWRELLARLDETGDGIGELKSLVRHVSDQIFRLSPDHEQYEQRYRSWIPSAHGELELFGADLPDEARRQQISVAYVSLALTVSGDGEDDVDSVTAEHLFDRLPALGRRLLIRGEAGSGKTTLLRWAAVQMGIGEKARAEHHRFEPRKPSMPGLRDEDQDENLIDWRRFVPFLIRLRDHPGGMPSVADFAALAAGIIGPPPPGWITDALDQGRALVMIDGVDEVGRFDRPKYERAIGQLVNAYPKTAFVVTSRPAAVPSNWLRGHGFADAEISPLARIDQSNLIACWHKAVEMAIPPQRHQRLKAKEEQLRARLEGEPALARLGSNPLMLSMLCALHYRSEASLPERAYTLCEDLCKALLHERDRQSGLRCEAIDPHWAALDVERKRKLMRDVAYHLTTVDPTGIGSSIEITTAERVVAQVLEGFGMADVPVSSFLETVVERSGVLRRSAPGRIDFLHNTLKEFLASEYFVQKHLAESLIARAGNPEWQQVVLFGAGGRDDIFTELLFSGLLKRIDATNSTKTRRLRVIAWATGSIAVHLDPALRERHTALENEIVPPRNFEEAELLAEAGDQILPALARAKPTKAEPVAATVRALRLIGTPRAKALIAERFSTDTRRTVLDELVQILNPCCLPAIQALILKGQTLPEGWRRLIGDVAPLSFLSGLQHLYLNGTGVSDISPLAGLSGLQYLDLLGTGVSDISPLAGLSGLQSLYLGGTAVSDVSPLAGLSGLQHLDLVNTGVSDVSPLAGLSGLQSLYLRGTAVSDVSPLAGLSGLQHLDLRGTGVTDVSPLAGLSGLQVLYLNGTGVTDVSPLAGLSGLQFLDLVNTGVSDVSPLAGLSGLQVLDLNGTAVSDVSPLAGLKNLKIFR